MENLVKNSKNIQAAGMTFNNVVNQIKKIVEENPDYKENWNTFYTSDAGIMLIELMAWVAENISIRQDVLYNEMFIETAKKDENKVNLLKQIGCSSDLAISATVPVELKIDASNGLPETLTFGNVNDGFISIAGQSPSNRTVNFEFISIDASGKPDYLTELSVPTNNNTIVNKKNEEEKILLVQGQTNYKNFTSETNDGPFFDITDNNVAFNSIRVYDNNNIEHKQINSFVDIEMTTTKVPVYILERTKENKIRIKYPSLKNISVNNNTKALFNVNSDITVYYRTTDGKEGNISAGSLKGKTFSISKDAYNFLVTINDNEVGFGGKNAQTLDDAVKYKPTGIKTLNRAVTAEDFDYLLNENAKVLKSKTYSAANQPDNFKNFYGRNINPQEIFSFIIMNKNLQKKEDEDYNDLPFVILNKEHLLNKKYIFNKASLNNKQLYYSFDDKNQAVLNVTPEEFNTLIDGETSETLVLKVHKTEQEENYIKNIKNDWLFSNVFDGEKNEDDNLNEFLSLEKNIITNENVSAVCSSKELNAPINILKYIQKEECINIEFDNLVNTKIYLDDDFKQGVDYSSYYILPDNPTPDPEDDSIDASSEKAANCRKGLKQLINEQVIGTIRDESNNSDIFRLIDGKHIYKELPVNNLSVGNGTEYAVKINGTIYVLTLGEDTFNAAMNYFEEKGGIYYKALEKTCYISGAEYYEYSDGEFTEQLKNIGDNVEGLYSKTDLESLQNPEYNNENGLLIQLSYLMLADLHEDKQYISGDTFDDLLNYKFSLRKVNDKNIFIFSNTTPKDSFEDEENFIEDVDTLESDYSSLVKLIIGEQELKKTIKADYSEVAKYGKINKKDKLIISSPLKGSQSTLKISVNDSENIISELFGIQLYKSSTENSKTSVGKKEIKLVKQNDEVLGVKKGNIVLTSNDITNNFFENVYVSFKQSKDEAVLLTGNNNEPLIGIAGEAVTIDDNNIPRIDLKKSNFDIRITEGKKQTNSLYNINKNSFEELGIIENKKVKIETAGLKSENNLTDAKVPIVIGIDMSEDQDKTFSLDVGSVNEFTASSIYNAAKSLRDNKDTDLINCLLITPDNDSRIIISNFDKSDKGNISFIYPDKYGIDDVKMLYKKLFGTSETNKNFYNLYPKEAMLKENHSSVIIKEGEEYYYCPNSSYKLKFIFRDFVEKEKDEITSKFGDYYINVEGDSFGKYKYTINKTKYSEFPDVEFYLHLINDKNKFDNSNAIVTDEDYLQDYFSNKKILGTEINFLKPYVKTFDYAATVTYSPEQNLATLKKQVEQAIQNEFSLSNIDNISIANEINESKIINIIYKVINPDGVNNNSVITDYFGFDYQNQAGNQSLKKLTADFNEVICIADTIDNKKGLILKWERL